MVSRRIFRGRNGEGVKSNRAEISVRRSRHACKDSRTGDVAYPRNYGVVRGEMGLAILAAEDLVGIEVGIVD